MGNWSVSGTTLKLPEQAAEDLRAAVLSSTPVTGLTHNYYRYPARFSPEFARQAIQIFTSPGEGVLDPFMGGGTTLVEACALGRVAIGTDVSSLASFVAKVKTTTLTKSDIVCIQRWMADALPNLTIRQDTSGAVSEEWRKYQRNLRSRRTWPICKLLEVALLRSRSLVSQRQRDFVRCTLLRTGQWALDCRVEVPSTRQFRETLAGTVDQMIAASCELAAAIRSQPGGRRSRRLNHAVCMQRSAVGLETARRLVDMPTPRLVLTSPPYPGVHVVYHRWQIRGRKETPAPFWLANCVDGMPEAFYTFGSRHQAELKGYFDTQAAAFDSIRKLADEDTLVVQMVAFSDPVWQLSTYLDVLAEAGFVEVKSPLVANSDDGRLWRTVPNRKWYAGRGKKAGAAREVVLFHRKGLNHQSV